MLRAICRWAEGEDIIRRSPCRGITLPSKGRAPTGMVLDSDDLTRLTSAMVPADATMVWLMALLGLRWGEAAAIQVRSIEFALDFLSLLGDPPISDR